MITIDEFRIAIKEALDGWIEMRNVNKKKMGILTERAVMINVKNAYKYSNGNPEKGMEIFDRSVANGWAGVYPYRDFEKDVSGYGKKNEMVDVHIKSKINQYYFNTGRMPEEKLIDKWKSEIITQR